MTSSLWPVPSIGTLALRALRRHPDRIAFVDDSGSLSYAATTDMIGRFQHVLAAHGLSAGDRLAVLAGNSAQAWSLGIAAQASRITMSWIDRKSVV